MIKLLKYLSPKQWLWAGISVVLIVAQVWLELTLPDYVSKITTLVETEGSQMSAIWSAGGKMLLCALGSMLLAFVVGFFVARLAGGFSHTLRQKVYTSIQNFGQSEIKRFSTPSLITRTTNDISQIQSTIAMGLQVLIKAPIMAVWATIKILGKSWKLSLATAITVVLLITMLILIFSFAIPRFKKTQKLTDAINRVTRENLTGLRVVHAYNAEQFEQNKFDKANTEITRNNLFIDRIMSIMSPGMSLLMNGLSLSIWWIGTFMIQSADGIASRINVLSQISVFSLYAIKVVMAFMMLTMIFIMMPRAQVSANRILEVLNTEPSVKGGDFCSDTDVKGEIEFRNVSFKYPDADEYVLRDISFTAHKGETVAFIGSTGSGKSTLINLVPRFYDATEGDIIIDGVNIRDYSLSALNKKIGYVSQRAVIFKGDVQSNVNFGDNDADLARVEKAVEIAQAKPFVDNMPNGISSEIAQNGANISGGQKQRLAIARAVCRDPEIYIFDDSFSALDFKTDKTLREALRKETADATSLIVAQRIGTIMDADKIIVLEQGEMVGIGTHRELVKNCEVYREIALSQLSKEEVENA